jgi:hypothetical protein
MSVAATELTSTEDVQRWLQIIPLNQVNHTFLLSAKGKITKRRVQKHQTFYMLQVCALPDNSAPHDSTSTVIQLVVHTDIDGVSIPESSTAAATPVASISSTTHDCSDTVSDGSSSSSSSRSSCQSSLHHITPHFRVGAWVAISGFPGCDRAGSLSLYVSQASLTRCAPEPTAIYRLLLTSHSFMCREELMTALMLTNEDEGRGAGAEELIALTETLNLYNTTCDGDAVLNNKQLQQACAQYSRLMLGKYSSFKL